MARIILFILLILFPTTAFMAKAQEHNVRTTDNNYILIISSYPYEEAWSTTIAKSIRSKIEKEIPHVAINIAYAGLGNRNSFLSERFALQKTFTLSKERTRIMIPSVLILIGEESWMVYRAMNHKGIWDKIPVVLCGVGPKVMKDYSNYFGGKNVADSLMLPTAESVGNLPVTAIMEKENELMTLSMMKDFFPTMEEIVFISTGNYQDRYAFHNLQKAINSRYPQLSLKLWQGNKKNPDQIRQQLNQLPPHTGVLVYSYRVPENTSPSVPVFTLFDQAPKGVNVIGGYYTPIEEYATEAAYATIQLYQGIPIDSFPFKFAEHTTVNLNKEALTHFDLKKKAAAIPNITYINAPPTFFARHYRLISFIGLTITVIIFLLTLWRRAQHHRIQILSSFERYKGLYEEYMAVYDNMPVGMLMFDREGRLLHRNPNSDFFFDLICDTHGAFHLFKNDILDDLFKEDIQRKENVNKLFFLKNHYLHFIIRNVQNGNTSEEGYLMIILDNTDIQQTEIEKENIYDTFHFAMDASNIGVAEYNLLDKTGIATQAWFDIFDVTGDTSDFALMHQHIVEEDQKKALAFFDQIGTGERKTFYENVRLMRGNTIHWVRVLIQLTEYAPQEGRIICTELAINIDDQKQREEELAVALRRAQESDRIKNAFVANMSDEIRFHVKQIVTLSDELTHTREQEQRIGLLQKMQEHNDRLLQYITQIIVSSKEESGGVS